MRIKKAIIHNYKSLEPEQTVTFEPTSTVLVGMNESGKTSVLEALAKANYFTEDKTIGAFDKLYDFPRGSYKTSNKSGLDEKAITIFYEIDSAIIKLISDEMSIKLKKELAITTFYSNNKAIVFNFDNTNEFIEKKLSDEELVLTDVMIEQLKSIDNNSDFTKFIDSNSSSQPDLTKKLNTIFKPYYNLKIENLLGIKAYIYSTYLSSAVPKFLYYDEYYSLIDTISLNMLKNRTLKKEHLKTARALFELADIDLASVKQDNFEQLNAELSATSITITNELFKYWKTNQSLEILFKIDKQLDANSRILDYLIKIRVKNMINRVDLPLEKRSKGFVWFFSFLVWFMKIQEDKSSSYILLLDEPGLNLHGLAQKDLLDFIRDLTTKYQVIYTTHSPFMIDPNNISSIRTVSLKKLTSVINDNYGSVDSNTLFPLQAALGYSLAQNLFISPKNLLVEGPSDLIYLTTISNILKENRRVGLNDDITIVPVGGADKVSTFISLLRGNDLSIVCLLDTINNDKTFAKLSDLTKNNIIKNNNLLYFHDFTKFNNADIEDLFSKNDYLKLYNGAFADSVSIDDLNSNLPILDQLLKLKNFTSNKHYRPAKYLLSTIDSITLDPETLDNFSAVIRKVNSLFK